MASRSTYYPLQYLMISPDDLVISISKFLKISDITLIMSLIHETYMQSIKHIQINRTVCDLILCDIH